ncbi:MAG: TIGR03564 family F420-dependent LLM class oxidoreductase [Actinomycetia bacterium]|nr:TIGR03564 family F420-dependent LLM class oxidoreductase [Actinomycetes bacterium]
MRIGTMLSMPGDVVATKVLIERAVAAEQAGFASAWLPQVGTVDALTALALAGRDTASIELGTAVVPTYPRHPVMLAEQALTVQNATDNRLALGIGLSHRFFIKDSLGLDYSRPIPHTRDYLTILNGLLAGEVVDHTGTEYQVKAQVNVVDADKPPVLVAALGPAMLRLCGRLSDGTITWMGGINYLGRLAIPTMGAAADAAGRPAPRFVAMVPVLLSDDLGAGSETINDTFGGYGQIPSYRATLDRGGAAVPADVAVIGNADAIEVGLQAFADIGVSDFVAVVPPSTSTSQATRELLADMATTHNW